MRILILSDAGSIHTRRWVKALNEKGMKLALYSLTDPHDDYYLNLGIEVFSSGISSIGSVWSKIRYFKSIPNIRAAIKKFHPDIVHAHYASSYGSLGGFLKFHPYIISVWGSDIYDFPNSFFGGKILMKYILGKADYILSTSNVMACETKKYTNKKISITPFGVDLKRFKKIEVPKQSDVFTVGNVKTLSPKYGIDVLIRAFKLVVERNPELNTRLVIYGQGPCRYEYEQLVKDLGLCNYTEFCGWIENEELPKVYSSMTVSVSVSVLDSESFGVVAVEAMACECPVVTSDVDGFTEVVDNGVTGFIVPRRDEVATANAIQKFIDNSELRQIMGKAGRERVERLYDWNKNVDTMIEIYNRIYEDIIN